MNTPITPFLKFGTACLFTLMLVIGAPMSIYGEKVYIRDRTGEQWDITDAVENGFKARRFNFGLGKSAIPPLSDADLGHQKYTGSDDSSILGVSVGKESHAYPIGKLAVHEIANTTIGGNKIAAAY